ncbi:GntR family transcriptional regulator [Paenibacillus jiagnxiensis]|uniref:GntR family transcriptional regulator n=1 Tax=Paenibacillus jiagnxiensis TaxID=3228926 RepID=UPI0033B19D79
MKDLINFSHMDHQGGNPLPYTIANHILRKIFLEELAQGARLTESEIAKELQVSHIPVREAFYILQNYEILERAPRKGVRVKAISRQELADYANALIELYAIVLRHSKEKWNSDKHDRLRSYLEEADKQLKEGNLIDYLVKCDELCRYLFVVGENKAFLRFYSEITYITTAFCQSRWRSLETAEKCQHHLQAAVNALIEGNMDLAAAELENVTRYSINT